MDDRTLYETILGLEEPSYVEDVEDVEVAGAQEEVRARVSLRVDADLRCPKCSEVAPGYDRARERPWRHLDTCQFRAVLVARIPRVECLEHGVHQIRVPWAEDRSRFTAMFEAFVYPIAIPTRAPRPSTPRSSRSSIRPGATATGTTSAAPSSSTVVASNSTHSRFRRAKILSAGERKRDHVDETRPHRYRFSRIPRQEVDSLSV